MSNDPLADALIGTGSADYGTDPAMGSYCTAWNPVTRENVITDGAVTYTNLSCLAPTLMSTGRVLLIRTGGRPIILGPLYSPTV